MKSIRRSLPSHRAVCFPFPVLLAIWMCPWLCAAEARAEAPRLIQIDGKFADWADVKNYTDPADDQHDTNRFWRDDQPKHRDHPDVDLLEFKFTHDAENLYAYFRTRGEIARTQVGLQDDKKDAGRYHALIAIDVDNNDATGYWLHRGGYFPTSGGYDVNAEVEWFDGEFNAGQYMNHCVNGRRELRQAFLDQSKGEYTRDKDGPYPAGFMRLAAGSYRCYTQWSFHEDGTITFTEDKGPVVPGIMKIGLSEDGHELELGVPMKGLLVDEKGSPIIELGRTIDVSFSLEGSGELSPERSWASDTGEPIIGYVLEPPPKP